MLFKRRQPAPSRGGTVNLRSLDAKWHQLNQPFTMNDNLGPAKGSSVMIEPGTRPIVFSAPHAVHHFRRGGLKTNDANTGGLAIALAKHLDATVIALRRGGPDFGDPNADLDHPLKSAAADLVGPDVVFADLHGMADREFDVIIGLGASPTPETRRLAERFVTVGATHKVTATIADAETGFNAKGPATMTTWAATRGATSMQFEIARRLRSVKSPAERRIGLLRTFVEVLG
jgi:hypothetical protein